MKICYQKWRNSVSEMEVIQLKLYEEVTTTHWMAGRYRICVDITANIGLIVCRILHRAVTRGI